MKKLILFLTAVLLLIVFSGITFANDGVLNAGTIIQLRTAETLKPNTCRVGDVVNLFVMSDVLIDGQVVIESGAMAKGEIIKSKNHSMFGIPAEIGFKVSSITLKNGKTVPLSGEKYIQGDDNRTWVIIIGLIIWPLWFINGGEADIPSGTYVEAMTISNTQIDMIEVIPPIVN